MKHKHFISFIAIFFVIVLASFLVFSSCDSNYSNHSSQAHHDQNHDEHDHDNDTHEQEKVSQVTVWNERFEIFLEHAFISRNEPTEFITHVTDLLTLEPRKKGPVTFVLRYGTERPIRHSEPAPSRDGIYIPELTFPKQGKWSLSLLIPIDGKEHIVELPSLTVYGSEKEIERSPFPEEMAGIRFLKEQQWEIKTKTEPVLVRNDSGQEVLLVPESALVDEDGKLVAFVQLAGETFEKRYLILGSRENGFVQVLSGLANGEYVTTKGAFAIARAEQGKEVTVHLSDEQEKRFGIAVDRVGSGNFDIQLSVPGEIVINTDRMAHIVPRIPGIVQEVKKKLGDAVKAGEVMAIIESRDLADIKSNYLASIERFDLANAILAREEKLWKDKISSEEEYLDAKNAFAEAKIHMLSSEQKLRALDFNSKYLERLHLESAERLTTFEITAPFNGSVIQKHLTLGEVVRDDADAFVVADLDTVWVDLQVHQKDIDLLEEGQKVTILAKAGVPETEGVINYIDPVIDEKTRTALARMEVDNSLGRLRPGTFITANILIERRDAQLMVFKDILQDIDDHTCVFVRNEHGFEARSITIGRSNEQCVEIVSGLSPGEIIATENSFRLKAELEKTVGGDDGHGHAH